MIGGNIYGELKENTPPPGLLPGTHPGPGDRSGAARELFNLLNKNGFYSIEDLGAIANIILKSEGKTPRRQW